MDVYNYWICILLELWDKEGEIEKWSRVQNYGMMSFQDFKVFVVRIICKQRIVDGILNYK